MKKFTTFVGIDISKKTFDAAIYTGHTSLVIMHRSFDQSPTGYGLFLAWLQEQSVDLSNTLICMEHTGLYITSLVHFLNELALSIWIEMPLRIKKSMGLQRGGNDKVAAIGIAQYAYRYQDSVKLYNATDVVLEQLRHLVAQRNRLLKCITQLSVPLQELQECDSTIEVKPLLKNQDPAIKGLAKSLAKVEADINKHIKMNSAIKNKIDKVSSIKGIGLQTALNLYVYTKGFTACSNGKQLACYCGVAPFTKSSGTSVRYKTRVSPFANKELKTLLYMCAMSAIQWNDELKQYYERKILEGKNKMSVINAVKNKLVQRVYAVVRDDRKFVENYVYKP
jgi:transposase